MEEAVKILLGLYVFTCPQHPRMVVFSEYMDPMWLACSKNKIEASCHSRVDMSLVVDKTEIS